MEQILSYYHILGLPDLSSTGEVKSTYRKLALLYHPDRNDNSPKAEAVFKIINDAYQFLSDEDKKQEYDSYIQRKSRLPREDNPVRSSKKQAKAPIYSSPEVVFSQINRFLWDIEDFISGTGAHILQQQVSANPLHWYVIKILSFIDKWLLGPAGYENYFLGKPGRSKVQIMNYFYNLRIRVDKHFKELTFSDLAVPFPGYDINTLDAVFEAEKHTVHYLSHMEDFVSGHTGVIPEYQFSKMIWAN